MLQNLRTVITSVLSHLEVKEEKDQNDLIINKTDEEIGFYEGYEQYN